MDKSNAEIDFKEIIKKRIEDCIRADAQLELVEKKFTFAPIFRAFISQFRLIYFLIDWLYDTLCKVFDTLEEELPDKQLIEEEIAQLKNCTSLLQDEGIRWVLQELKQKMSELENEDKDE